jgi:membrane carboxypeptidase/penicillin-binding protein PbpC
LSFSADLDRLTEIVGAIKMSSVDQELAMLMLALEDNRFWQHRGVDPIAILRAAFHWASGRPKGGASTIDMQLVRTLTGQRERTARRKLREILLAMRLRRQIGAKQILAAYTTVAYCGEGVTGLIAASLCLHGRPPNLTSSAEKAAVAAVLLNPIPAIPTARWRSRLQRRAVYALERADHVTRRSRDQPAARFSDEAP